jgi:hypothetical protein
MTASVAMQASALDNCWLAGIMLSLRGDIASHPAMSGN